MARQPVQLVEQQRALGRYLATFREAAGLFQADIARSVPCHRTTVTHAEAGSQLPDSHFWETVDRVVGANGALLAKYDSLIQAKESYKADQIAARRARAQAAAQEIAAARRSQERGARNLASHPLVDVRQLTSQLDDIAQRYETLPSVSLLAEAGQCHASIGLLLRYAQSEPGRRELHAAATASATLMSQLVWDVSGRRDYTTTVAYCDEAIAHGRECGDAIAVAHAELMEAATATLHAAIDLLEGTRGGGGLTVVFGAGRELYPWRNEQAVHDVQDRLLALVART
ncbi:MAG: helix-turn-helix domain-containing protein [Pseudonocardiales bacterium]|nr:helix-turn-helix domain-containing protein [Pseudonocardiales bacterium]